MFLCSSFFAFSQGKTCVDADSLIFGSQTIARPDSGNGAQGGGINAHWFTFSFQQDSLVGISNCASAAGVDSRLFIYEGPNCTALTVIANVDDNCLSNEEVDFPVQSGKTYYVEWTDIWDTSSFSFEASTRSSEGLICDKLTPVNIGTHTCPGIAFGEGAKSQSSPRHIADATHAFWYSFTAPKDSFYHISSCPDNPVGALNIYTGSCSTLKDYRLFANACDTNLEGSFIYLRAGETYVIEWTDGKSDYPYYNDRVKDPFDWKIEYADITSKVGGRAVDACREYVFVDTGTYRTPLNMWFGYQSPVNGTLKFSSCGNTVDTYFQLYHEYSNYADFDNDLCLVGHEIASVQNNCGLQEEVLFPVEAGKKIRFNWSPSDFSMSTEITWTMEFVPENVDGDFCHKPLAASPAILSNVIDSIPLNGSMRQYYKKQGIQIRDSVINGELNWGAQWYRLTGLSVPIEISSCGENVNTRFSLLHFWWSQCYSNHNAFQDMRSFDNSCGEQEMERLVLEPGRQHFIAWDNFHSTEGFTWEYKISDQEAYDCLHAAPVNLGVNSISGPFYKDISYSATGLWHKFSYAEDTTIFISNCASGVNSHLQVFTGSCGNFEEVQEFDDNCGNGEQEFAEIQIEAFKEYYIVWYSTHSNETFDFKIGLEPPTGMLELSEESLKIVPNPATNQMRVFFSTEEELDFRVYSSLGAEVLRSQMEAPASSHSIDVSQLDAGVYFLSASSSKGQILQRFIKQ